MSVPPPSIGDVSRVLLVDDDPLVRRLLATILTSSGIDVVGEASDGDEVVAAVQRHHPDVVLMDLRMARVQGVEATAAVVRLPGAPAVVALTAFDTDDSVLRAVRAGARGFLPKDADPEDIVAAVRAVAAGGAVVAPRAARFLVEQIAQDVAARRCADARQAVGVLTGRELEVARAVADGLTNSEIAERTYCSEATVKTYLARAMAKLAVGNRVQLALLVDRAGATAS